MGSGRAVTAACARLAREELIALKDALSARATDCSARIMDSVEMAFAFAIVGISVLHARVVVRE